ncbi:hypothetical protein CRENBAI_001991 [Crenichthys baileyi]|uniref:Uncharacterized protein n=1 Tax=Crenichthys baileyi TaxID=28760 RepID=A0AAV9QZ32_9TELE
MKCGMDTKELENELPPLLAPVPKEFEDETPSHLASVRKGFKDELPPLPVSAPEEFRDELPPFLITVPEGSEDELPLLPVPERFGDEPPPVRVPDFCEVCENALPQSAEPHRVHRTSTGPQISTASPRIPAVSTPLS